MSRDAHAFRAMGVEVVVGGGTDAERSAIRELFERWDAVLSRFRPTSELNAVNASPASTVLVSPLFAQVTRIALRAARANGGVVDPTLGRAIVAAGYDTAGTDSDTAWGAAVYASCGGAVVGVVAWRTLRARATPWAARLSLATGTVVGAELVLALTLGPLAHHG